MLANKQGERKTAWECLKVPAFKFFGRSLEPYVPYFDSIKPDLQKANIKLSIAEYVYITFFTCLLIFLIEFPLLVFITVLLLRSALLAFIFSFTLTLAIELALFFFFYTYPSYIASTRQKHIDSALPFATTYMATIASSGAPPVTMFKVLGEFKEYGEISYEAEKIYRNVAAFGMDLIGSMRKTASRSPSTELRELLWGLDTVITTGSNIGNYLREKAKGFMQEYRRRLQQYAQTLSLLIEIYLTLILVGSIFFVIMSALMGMFGGTSSLFLLFMQFLVVFILLPVISIGFIVLLKSMAP